MKSVTNEENHAINQSIVAFLSTVKAGDGWHPLRISICLLGQVKPRQNTTLFSILLYLIDSMSLHAQNETCYVVSVAVI